MDVVTGFALSHICILDLLNPGCSAALAWLQLTLQVSLLLVLTTTAGVLFKARIRDRVGARLRLVFAALAEDGRNGRA
jgi:Tfp pilus assembly protein PilN